MLPQQSPRGAAAGRPSVSTTPSAAALHLALGGSRIPLRSLHPAALRLAFELDGKTGKPLTMGLQHLLPYEVKESLFLGCAGL